MKKKLASMLIVFSCMTLCHSGIFDWISPAKPKSKIEQLEEKLVNRPKDPEVNYNLGVAYYKEKKINDAIQCFKRAFDYGTNLEIKKRSSFNAGNGLYQSVLAGLPHNWEKKETEVDPQLLVQSTMMAKDAVEQYAKTLSIDPVDVKAKTNKKKAEELLKKLQEKQQQKPQDKQDKQDKKDKQQQGDQSQQDQNQGDQSKQEKNKGDHNSQNDQQQGKGKEKMKSPAEQQKEAGDKGLDKQESEQKQDTKHDHEKTPQQKEGQQQSPANQDKSDQGKEQAAAAAGKEDQKNSEEKRALGAILDSLKDDEKGLQKGLMMRDMQKKQQKDPIKSGQKQW